MKPKLHKNPILQLKLRSKTPMAELLLSHHLKSPAERVPRAKMAGPEPEPRPTRRSLRESEMSSSSASDMKHMRRLSMIWQELWPQLKCLRSRSSCLRRSSFQNVT